jgi:RHS repeat-associated protein
MTYSTTGRPHAVESLNTGAGTRTFTYNLNGAMTGGQVDSATRTIAWTSYDLPASITIGTTSRTFSYGPDRARYRQVSVAGAITRTYTYVGEHFVKEVEGSSTEYKLYFTANGEQVGYVSDDGTPEVRYFHKDHLGSITTIVTNQNVAGREKLSYDAWGKRRSGTDWFSAAAAASEERGYTGHEHLDNVNLIHMNGRLLDPTLGRVISADPFISDPLYSQSYNRFSYVYNNPLRRTDPTGFSGCCDENPRPPPSFPPGPQIPYPNPLPPHCFNPGQVYCWFDGQIHDNPFTEEYLNAMFPPEPPPAPLPRTPQAATDTKSLTPTVSGALWDIGAGVVLAGAGFVPYVGDALDGYDLVRPSASTTDRAIAGTSLAINAWTAGLAPNAGPIVRGGRRVGSGVGDLYRASKDSIASAADSVKNGVRSTVDRVGGWARNLMGGCGCFVAGTLVATSMGLTPIEDIDVGDQVWARDEQTGELALKPVTALIRPSGRVIWKVTFQMDEGTGADYADFEVTDDHPWGSIDGTWVRTDELKPGMEIQRAHGVPARVVSVTQAERAEQTYNLEVSDFHTYFVGKGWVWVHNAKPCAPAPDFDTARRDAFEHAQMTDPNDVEFSKYDPETGTVVEFKGPNGAKVGYDGPHSSPGPNHDTQHISAQEPGKRSQGEGLRRNFPYSGPQHPSRSDRK